MLHHRVGEGDGEEHADEGERRAPPRERGDRPLERADRRGGHVPAVEPGDAAEDDAERAHRVHAEVEPGPARAGRWRRSLGPEQVERHDVGEEAGDDERRVHREHTGEQDDVGAGGEHVAPQVHEVGHDVRRVRQEQHEGGDAAPPRDAVAGAGAAEQHDGEHRGDQGEREVPRDPVVVVAARPRPTRPNVPCSIAIDQLSHRAGCGGPRALRYVSPA